MLKGVIRKAIWGNKKTSLPASIAMLALAYGIASNPEQAEAISTTVVAVAALVWGQYMSKDGDKDG